MRLNLFLIAAFCRLANFLSLVSADRSLLRAVGWKHPRPCITVLQQTKRHCAALPFQLEPFGAEAVTVRAELGPMCLVPGRSLR